MPATVIPTEDAETTKTRGRVSGIDRVLQILDYLREIDGPAGPYAIAKAIGAPLSTIYVIIDELVERSMLIRREDKTVWLGPRLYHYGLAYSRRLDFLAEARHEMDALCREVSESVQICARDGDNMVVLLMADGPGHFRVTSEIGTSVPLNWTASGRLLVGHLPDAERQEVFARSAKASPTGRAVINPDDLARLSADAFKARLSIQISETDFQVSCVASPVCDRSGACVATISIVLPEQKVLANGPLYAEAVKRASLRVEQRLGWAATSRR